MRLDKWEIRKLISSKAERLAATTSGIDQGSTSYMREIVERINELMDALEVADKVGK